MIEIWHRDTHRKDSLFGVCQIDLSCVFSAEKIVIQVCYDLFEGQVKGLLCLMLHEGNLQLLTRIRTFVQHFEVPYGFIFVKNPSDLGQFWLLCGHFLA